MNDEEPQGDRGSGDGGEPISDADSWVAEWVDLFERPDPDEDRGRPAPLGGLAGPGADRPAEVGRPIVSPSGAEPGEPERLFGRRFALGLRLAGLERPAADDDVAAIEAWQRAQERSRRKAQVRANQRTARQIQRARPDRAGPSQPVANLAVDLGGDPTGSVRRLGLVAGGLLVVIVGLVGYLFVGQGQTDVAAGPDPTVPGRDGELSLTVGADVAPATIEQLTLSTVQLVLLDENGVAQCAGSGVIVASDGAILTNAHVVTSRSTENSCRFTTIGVAVTRDSSSPAELLYRAEVDQLRLDVDLAVLRIAGPLDEDGDAPWPRTFAAAPLGDSDTVELGDPVRILGYPVIGGETITLTTGTVSGFTSQVGLGNRALIKTDASISAGNSGGLAVDAAGRVIGIPTKARASERGPAVDCRPVTDTNDDGVIGDDDACVTVGGFLNGIRPINLSLALLAAANVSDEDRQADVGVGPGIEPHQVMVSNPRFSTGIDEDGVPINEISTATAGIPELCFTFDWQGIPLGAEWSAAWYLESQIIEESAEVGQSWTRELDGQDFSLCHEAAEGLPPGIHEIVFYLGEAAVFVESIEITRTPVEQLAISWTNDTDVDLCGLAINPLAPSGHLGLDELPDGLVIPPGGNWTTTMPRGEVIVEAYDCDNEPVANKFDGLAIEKAGAFSISADRPPEE